MSELLVKLENYLGYSIKSISGFARTVTINKNVFYLEEFPVEIMTELFIEFGMTGDVPEAV